MENHSTEFATNLVANFKRLFFDPEIKNRKKNKPLEKEFKLIAGQVIFFPNEKEPLVRLNNEISANAKLKEVQTENGEIKEAIDRITLNEEEFENCGHATFIFDNGNLLHCSFDFLRNKALVKKHLKSAKEFYRTAKFALDNHLNNAFIDNAFSAMELLAKAELLLQPSSGLESKSTHNKIKSQYNRSIKSLVDESEKNRRVVFNKLSSLRNNARYLRGENELKFQEDEILKTIDSAIESIECMTGDKDVQRNVLLTRD